MRGLSRIFWTGLVTVLPIAVTIAILYWIGLSLETVLGGIVRLVVSREHYVPGTGIAVAFVLVLLIGAMMRAWVVRSLLEFGDALIARIPLAKTIYGAVRDIIHYLGMMAEDRRAGSVVLVDLAHGPSVLGFITSETLPFTSGEGDEPLVAVYLPMSYQIGGYTVCLPSSKLRRVDMSSEQAMRWVLTAGVSRARP